MTSTGQHQRVFVLLLLVLGVWLFRDYGISWDEPISRNNGAISLQYLATKLHAPWLSPRVDAPLPRLQDYPDRDYGVAFELPAAALEKVSGLKDSRQIFMLRHLLIYLVFVAGVWAVWRMAERRFNDWRIGLLAGAFLLLSPRMFAAAFYNSKDIVFMAVFAIAMNTMFDFVFKPTMRSALLHALATAFAIDVRIMALVLVAATAGLMGMSLARKERPGARALGLLALYGVACCGLVVLMWPWLWADPWERFTEAFGNMAAFRWPGEVLFMGGFIPATQLPWQYIPTWVSITTPALYLALFLLGLAATAFEIVSSRLKVCFTDSGMQDLAFAVLVIGPVAAVIALRSVLYDGWRQLYFIYPALLLVAVKGWVVLWQAKRGTIPVRLALAAVTVASSVQIASWMREVHPMQNIYFNRLAQTDWRHRYDLDYWGLANRQALEYIAARDSSPVINVHAASATPIGTSLLMLEPGIRARFQINKGTSDPLYVFDNYRMVHEDHDAELAKGHDVFYRLLVDGESILTVYKRRRFELLGGPGPHPGQATIGR